LPTDGGQRSNLSGECPGLHGGSRVSENRASESLPESFFAFLTHANGGEGFIRDRYVQLWRAEELAEMNRAYKTAEFFPNLFFIGSDGGGEAYAFDLSRTDAVVFQVPFIGLPTDARAIASSFDSFLAT